MAKDVFISYRRSVSEDKARIIQQSLSSKGYDVFLDYDSLKDGKYRKKEEEAIRSCHAFILLLSEGTLDRCMDQDDELAIEIRWAQKYGRHIIPVLVSNSYMEPDDLPVDLQFISELQFEQYHGGRFFEDSMRYLCDRIETISFDTPPSKVRVDSLPLLCITTLGQKGHGKSLLTAAMLKTLSTKGICSNNITYKDLNLPDVCTFSSGHSVHMVHVPYNTLKHRFQHIDCENHDDYDLLLTNKFYEFDGAILVVDAHEGPMPETRTHILMAKEAQIPRMVIYISKCDEEDVDLVDLVEEECRELLSFSGFDGDNTPVIRGSSLGAMSGDSRWISKIDDLLSALDNWIKPSMHAIDRPFQLDNIDDVCYIEGRGTIVHGKISVGTIRVGDVVTIPSTYPCLMSYVDEILMFGEKFEQAEAGDHVHLLLPDIGEREMDFIKKGMFIRKKIG